MSKAARRNEIHARKLDLRVYRRDDGQFDIEGHLVDVKPFPVTFLNSSRQADEPVHDLWLRLTVDRTLEVQDAEAHMDIGAYPYCTGVEPNFKTLRGLRIGPGWNRNVRERVGGGQGCTHLVEMLAQMATAALQGIWSELDDEDDTNKPPRERRLRTDLANSCHTYRTDGQFVKVHFPSHYQRNAGNEEG
ncbi:MAG: DUF2889 domain-containing protein [Pseudomonadota bacterium]